MGWVSKTNSAAKMRRSYYDYRLVFTNSFEFLHYLFQIIKVFQNMASIDFVEFIIFKWPRNLV